ncbi:MAG: dockerin type I repeat-containing protein, partial [Candidatus Aenigmatarchaeota archaeon]
MRLWVALVISALFIFTVSSAYAQMDRWDPLFDKPTPRLSTPGGDEPPECFVGDVNCDGVIGQGDVDYLAAYLGASGPAPDPYYLGDVDGSGIIDIGDITYLIDYIYYDGPAPGVGGGGGGLPADYFDLAITGITFSDNTPEVGQIIIIAVEVKNMGTVDGYVTGGSGSECTNNTNISCGGSGFGFSAPGKYIEAGESLLLNGGERSFSISGTWQIMRSFSGKGVNGEEDSDLTNNGVTFNLVVSKASGPVCGNGILEDGELCDYKGTGINNPFGDQCTTRCWVDGTADGWKGCRGSGAHVCSELVTTDYYTKYPSCFENLDCAGKYYSCNGIACPDPSAINTTNKTCTDSDGGLNYYEVGTVNIVNTDFCLVQGGAYTIVHEFYCDGNEVMYDNYQCMYGCA